jgi:hypothetical protein
MSNPNQHHLRLPLRAKDRRPSIQSDTSHRTGRDSSNASTRAQSTGQSSVSGDGQAGNEPSKTSFMEERLKDFDPYGDQSITENSRKIYADYYDVLDPPSMNPVTSIIKNNPHSKTAIGRLTYELENLPTLFVANLKTVHSPKADDENGSTAWPVVKHNKIRKDAIKELLSGSGIAHIAADIAISQDANTTVDHLVAPFKGRGTILHWEFHPRRINLKLTKKMASKADVDSGADSHRSVACEIIMGDPDEDIQAHLYWRSFGSLIRMRASQADDPTGDNIHAEFIQSLGKVTGQVNRIDPFQSLMESGTGVPLGVRIVPSFTTEHKRLHLDFDVVPYICKRFLHDVVLDVFDRNSMLANPAEYIDVLRELFAELQVRCAYIPSTDASTHATLLDQTNSHLGRLFRIKAIEMPDNVPEFNVNNEPHTVHSYFSRCKSTSYRGLERGVTNNLIDVLPQGRDLQYLNLPLVSDGKDHWVPLEMLIVEHAQALRHKRFLKATKAVAQSVLSSMNEAAIRAAGQEFLDRVNMPTWAKV